jgi:hypothetical protein
MTLLLPSEFAELEPFAATWCLETRAQSSERKMSSSISEMEAFYAACFPRLVDAFDYCDRFWLDELPDEPRRLLQLIYSLIMVSMSAEIFDQVRMVDAAGAVLHGTKDPRP